MEWIVGIVTGLISGLITGTITCWFFYRLSGRDLRREAENLRRLNVLIIDALVHAGLAEVNLDAHGNPVGLVYKFRGGIKFGGSAIIEVHRKPPTEGTDAAQPSN